MQGGKKCNTNISVSVSHSVVTDPFATPWTVAHQALWEGIKKDTSYRLSPWFNQKVSMRMTERILFWVNWLYLKLYQFVHDQHKRPFFGEDGSVLKGPIKWGFNVKLDNSVSLDHLHASNVTHLL